MKPLDQLSLRLRRSADGSVFVSPTKALAIPIWCARRCEVIEDIAGIQHGPDVDLPLPPSLSEAWLARAHQRTVVVNSARTGLTLDDHTVTMGVGSVSVAIPTERDIIQ